MTEYEGNTCLKLCNIWKPLYQHLRQKKKKTKDDIKWIKRRNSNGVGILVISICVHVYMYNIHLLFLYIKNDKNKEFLMNKRENVLKRI